MNSSDYIKLKKQKSMYSNAEQRESGFGIARTASSHAAVVVTARNYVSHSIKVNVEQLGLNI